LKRIVRYIIPALLVSFVCGAGICWATSSITATPNYSWPEIIGDPPPAAGSNLPNTSESDSAAVTINITASGNWGLKVEKSNWPSSLHLSIKKTSPTPVGDYQEVTDSYPAEDFISGSGDTTVTVQFKLTNVSIQVPPGTYNPTVTFWVYDK